MDWAPEYARSNTRAEQTHILAAMIQLFETGINVLYSVDYTGAIDNFSECVGFGAGILQGALFVIQVCNLHQKYSILDNGDFSGPGK